MTVPIPLDDIWQRFDWGDAEGKNLELWIADFIKQSPYMSHVHQDGERWKWDVFKVIPADVEAKEIAKGAKVVGSFLEHMRAALNYLTYQLALYLVAQDPSLQGKVKPNRVEFPIFDDPTTFGNENRIKDFPAPYVDAIESVQPYGGRYPGLWILHELAREYRHRVIHPMACYPFGDFDGFTGELPDFATDIQRTYQGGPLKGHNELFNFRSDREFNAEDYPNLMLGVGIDHTLCYGLSGMKVLAEITVTVGDILTDWSNEPWPPAPRTP